MAKVANPRKQFQFSIQIPGLYPFLAQKVTTPETDLDVVEHGDTNYIVKTAGIVKYGTLHVEKISSANGPDNFIWAWIKSIQDEYAGGGDIPDNYKKVAEIYQYATNGITIINTWQWEGVWPHKINGIELSRVQSDNTIENIEFCVDRQLRF